MVKVNNKKRDIEEKSFNIDSKYQKLMSKPEKIHDYPMIKTTLKELRKDEFRFSSNKRKAQMTFVNLFKNRLDNMEGKRETVSITIDVLIEFVRGMNISVTKKTYGPFTVKKPVNMSKMDVYKFVMYTLLNKQFNLLSGEYISGIGCQIIKLDKKKFQIS